MITLTAKIALADGTEIVIDKRNGLSIDESIVDRSDIVLPSWGIISNGGSLRFNDVIYINGIAYSGKIKEYADNLRLIKGLPASIFLNDTAHKTSYSFRNYFTKTWDYDSNSKEVLVQLTDGLVEWQEIYVKGFDYDARDSSAKNLRYFYEYLQDITPIHHNMVGFENLSAKTKEILENTYIKYPLLKSGSLWQQWNKLCIVSQSHIFKNNNGNTIFVYNEGD